MMTPGKIQLVIFLFFNFTAFTQQPGNQKNSLVKYYDAKNFTIEGVAFTDSVKEFVYQRFPVSYKNKLSEDVWGLSKSSAGIAIRFLSNSTSIQVKWQLAGELTMNHMAETGIKGLDLYYKSNGQWLYLNTARPEAVKNEFRLIENMHPSMREYKLYLPLYEGVLQVEIGVDQAAEITAPTIQNKPAFVFYGHSITQGGCASRPGMAYTNIIGRKLDRNCLNFGFSGNGKMDAAVAELIASINAACYIIDCTATMSPAEINQNAWPMVKIIRAKHAAVPILLIEALAPEKTQLDDSAKLACRLKNAALLSQFNQMQKAGIRGLFYIKTNAALGNDHEGTVDGVHFTDLGFMRFATFLIDKLKELNIAGIKTN
jgi:hypothetical protein